MLEGEQTPAQMVEKEIARSETIIKLSATTLTLSGVLFTLGLLRHHEAEEIKNIHTLATVLRPEEAIAMAISQRPAITIIDFFMTLFGATGTVFSLAELMIHKSKLTAAESARYKFILHQDGKKESAPIQE